MRVSDPVWVNKIRARPIVSMSSPGDTPASGTKDLERWKTSPPPLDQDKRRDPDRSGFRHCSGREAASSIHLGDFDPHARALDVPVSPCTGQVISLRASNLLRLFGTESISSHHGKTAGSQ